MRAHRPAAWRSPEVWLSAVAACLLTACATQQESVEAGPGIFYPSPPGVARLQFLGHYSTSSDIEETDSFERFVVGDVAPVPISRAFGVAWDRGRLLVTDPGAGIVFVLDFPARSMTPLGGPNVRFKKPLAIAVAPDGWKYVADTGHRTVAVFNAEDQFQVSFGDPEAWRPVGVAATADRLYVSDGANHQLVVLDRQTGAELQRIGKEGRDPGEFHFPVSVAIGPSGDVYVSDTLNNRVQQLHPDGEYVMSFGSMGTGFGQFTRPKGIAVDRAGRLYASDSAFENVQIMDAEGGLLLFFGGPGVQPGAMNMPASIAISYDAVATFSDRVASGHSIDYVVFVASGADPYKVNVYGFLKTD